MSQVTLIEGHPAALVLDVEGREVRLTHALKLSAGEIVVDMDIVRDAVDALILSPTSGYVTALAKFTPDEYDDVD